MNHVHPEISLLLKAVVIIGFQKYLGARPNDINYQIILMNRIFIETYPSKSQMLDATAIIGARRNRCDTVQIINCPQGTPDIIQKRIETDQVNFEYPKVDEFEYRIYFQKIPAIDKAAGHSVSVR